MTAAPVSARMRETSPKRRGVRSGPKGGRVPWFFVVPAAAVYVFVVLWPSVQGSGLAFTDWNGLTRERTYIGVDNFVEITRDQKASGTVVRTLVIAVVITIVQNVVGLLLALGVNTAIKSRNILRVILFAPAVITPVAVGFLWKNLYSTKGAINTVLGFFGVDFVSFLGDPNIAMWSICAVVIWQFAGVSMVIFLANLQSVPADIIEASHLDGAGPWLRFWYVVRPELAPAITITTMLSLIGGLRLYDQVLILTGGGPAGLTNTMSTLLVKNAFQYGEYGYGISMALVLAVLVTVLAAGQYAVLSRQNRG
jgi:raffinose/stachyose/melibiose transport system permease protein